MGVKPGPRFTKRTYPKNGVGYSENGVAYFQICHYSAVLWSSLLHFCVIQLHFWRRFGFRDEDKTGLSFCVRSHTH